MLIFDAMNGLTCGNNPFNEEFFKLGTILHKKANRQLAGDASNRDRNLWFFTKAQLPDR
jgi:hypothetical protein